MLISLDDVKQSAYLKGVYLKRIRDIIMPTDKQLQTMIASVVILFALPLASADYIFGSVYMGGSCDVRHTLLMK